MSGEREAVEARARAHREKVRDNYVLRVVGSGMATHAEYDEFAIMADFSLAENAELRKELDDARNEIHCSDDVRLDQGLAVAIGDLQKARAAAEAEVVKLREAIEQAIKCASGRWSEWGGRAESVADILESALNPGAAKEG